MSTDRTLLLQSFESHALRAELRGGGITPLPRSARQDEPTWGHYDAVGGVAWALYRGASGLVLLVGRDTLPVDGSLAFSLDGVGPTRRLVVARGGRPIASLPAPAPVTPLLEETLEATAFAEEEDFDFARFVVNVAGDEERRARIYVLSS